jgi:hypothetical protein
VEIRQHDRLMTARRELPLVWVAAMLVVGALFTLGINALMGGTVGTAPQRSADEAGVVRIDRAPKRARGTFSRLADNPRHWRKVPTGAANTGAGAPATAAVAPATAASTTGTAGQAASGTGATGQGAPVTGVQPAPAGAPQGVTGTP